MQKAEELIYRLRGGLSYIDSAGHKIGYTHPHLTDDTCIEAIRARDREIVEACKAKGEDYMPNKTAWLDWCDALDSVLRDLG